MRFMRFSLIDLLMSLGLRWSTISHFMRLRISQVAAVIPFAGYGILWSEWAEKTLRYQGRIQEDAWFTLSNRLHLIYFGSILLTVALVMFYIWCPRRIRRNPAVEDFIKEEEDTADRFTQDQTRHSINSMLVGNTPEFNREANCLVRAAYTPYVLARALQGHAPNWRTCYRAVYLQLEGLHVSLLATTAVLIFLGCVALLLPAVEVFILVTRMLIVG